MNKRRSLKPLQFFKRKCCHSNPKPSLRFQSLLENFSNTSFCMGKKERHHVNNTHSGNTWQLIYRSGITSGRLWSACGERNSHRKSLAQLLTAQPSGKPSLPTTLLSLTWWSAYPGTAGGRSADPRPGWCCSSKHSNPATRQESPLIG